MVSRSRPSGLDVELHGVVEERLGEGSEVVANEGDVGEIERLEAR